MILQLDLATHATLEQVRQFLEAALTPTRAEAYGHVEPATSTPKHKIFRMLESKLLEAVLCQTHLAIESP